MERISVTQAVRHFSELVNRVYYHGVSVELERGNKVVARLSPVVPSGGLQAEDLGAFLGALPKLEDDAEGFARDVAEVRAALPQEREAWG